MSFLGGGLSDGSWLYVPVPKNGSSAHRKTFLDAGWDKYHYARDFVGLRTYFVVRHPVDRWFAGVDQYSRSSEPGFSYWQLVDQVRDGRWPVFDEHTMRQSDFVLSTLSDVVFVRLEAAGRFVAAEWGLKLPVVNARARPTDGSLVGMLERFYKDDLELWNQANH